MKSGWRVGAAALLVKAVLTVGLVWALVEHEAQAGLPAAYAPMVVEPTGGNERAEFDLDPALQRARAENKSLYVYLGARDCPYCRRYEAFLAKNAQALVPHFQAKYLVVDLRSALLLQAPKLFFRVNGRSLDYSALMRELGDERVRQLVYPSVWLLNGQARPLMQMPAGTGTFETVEEQLEILRLVQ
jgi:thioredoxin-related protein